MTSCLYDSGFMAFARIKSQKSPVRPRVSHRGPAARRALVLAAGFGSRLHPLTTLVPKPLLPLCGTPMLERTLRMLAGWGVTDTIINLHHGVEQIVRDTPTFAPPGMRISFSYEPVILGTGGALRAVSWFFTEPEPFWIVNADVAAELDVKPLIQGLDGDGRAISNLWMVDGAGPRTVELRSGCVRHFRSAHAGAPGTVTFSGIQLARPELLRFIPPEGFCSLVEAYERARKGGWRVRGTVLPGSKWADIGTVEQYLSAHRLFGGHEAARLVNVGAASVAKRARVRGAVVAPGARVLRAAEGLVVPAKLLLRPDEAQALCRLDPEQRDEPWMAHVLPPRGSDRSFIRLEGRHRSLMLVREGGARPENSRYAGHARALAKIGVAVPAVLAESKPVAVPADQHAKHTGFLIMEDAGLRSLGDLVEEEGWGRATERWYRRVVEQSARQHIHGRALASRLELEPAFGPDVYGYERSLFIEYFVREILHWPSAACHELERELAGVSERLSAAPPVLLHRDFQSSNVLCPPGGPVWIDFQGMRLGPAMYDLASLLFDPYVSMPEDMRRRLLALYVEVTGAELACAELFEIAAVQRLTQALGAFGRLSGTPAGRRFLAHIPAGLSMLQKALDRLPNALPKLRHIARSQVRPSEKNGGAVAGRRRRR